MKRFAFAAMALFMLVAASACAGGSADDSNPTLVIGDTSTGTAPGEPMDIPAPPTDEPTYITGVVYDSGDGYIMVSETGSEGIRLISVATADAQITGEGHDIPGALVEVGTGAIAESYPEQCTAHSIIVLHPDEGSDAINGLAYYAIFEDLYATDTALQDSCIYLALDISEAGLSPTAHALLLAKMQQFSMNQGYTLLLDGYAGLVEDGYINEDELYFEDGFLISFENISIEADRVVTNAQKWRSGMGAIGAEYTAIKTGDTWKLSKTDMWIS